MILQSVQSYLADVRRMTVQTWKDMLIQAEITQLSTNLLSLKGIVSKQTEPYDKLTQNRWHIFPERASSKTKHKEDLTFVPVF